MLQDALKEEYYSADIVDDSVDRVTYVPSLLKKTETAYLLK